MKKETIIKRLTDAKLMTKKGKMAAYYHNVCKMLFKCREEKFYLKSWRKQKGIFSLIDSDHQRMLNLLDALKINYKIGNDAPRKGIKGDYIFIDKKEYKKLTGFDVETLFN